MASGVQEKVSLLSSFCKTPKPTIGMDKSHEFCKCVTPNFSFSEIFYIDATNEQTLKTDLEIIAPAVVGKSAEASLHWLAGKQEEWLLFFDNADDVQLDISKFFPRCTFGNILITTRNQELCIHASAGSRVSDMEPEDAKDLLLQLAYRGRSDKQEKLNSNEQEKLAVAIVKVFISGFFGDPIKTEA
jgi:hypothetical protein